MFGLTKQQTQELVIRAVVTAVQGFVIAWAAAGFSLETSVIGVAAGAGLSVAYNTVVKPWIEGLKGVKRA